MLKIFRAFFLSLTILSCNTNLETGIDPNKTSDTKVDGSTNEYKISNYYSDNTRLGKIKNILSSGVVYDSNDPKYNYSRLFKTLINECSDWWSVYAFKVELNGNTIQERSREEHFIALGKASWELSIDCKLFPYHISNLEKKKSSKWVGEIYKEDEVCKRVNPFYNREYFSAFRKSRHKGPVSVTKKRTYTLANLTFNEGCGFSILSSINPPKIYDYLVNRIFHKKDDNTVYIELVNRNYTGDADEAHNTVVYLKTIPSEDENSIRHHTIPENVSIDTMNNFPAIDFLNNHKKKMSIKRVLENALKSHRK